MIRVGIVAPMWGEAKCFMPPDLPRQRLSDLGQGVLLCVSGMGSERAALAARELLENGANALVSAGVAGGLDPRLSPGDLVIADRVLARDGGELPTDAAWRGELAHRLQDHIPCTLAALVESPGVLADPEAKRSCFQATGASAVDMESAAIAAEARRANVPCLVLRAVCDPADMCIPGCALAAADPFGKPRPMRFLTALLSRPGQIADVVRLQRAFREAQAALRAAARLAGTRLCASEQ